MMHTPLWKMWVAPGPYLIMPYCKLSGRIQKTGNINRAIAIKFSRRLEGSDSSKVFWQRAIECENAESLVHVGQLATQSNCRHTEATAETGPKHYTWDRMPGLVIFKINADLLKICLVPRPFSFSLVLAFHMMHICTWNKYNWFWHSVRTVQVPYFNLCNIQESSPHINRVQYSSSWVSGIKAGSKAFTSQFKAPAIQGPAPSLLSG